MSVSPTPSNSDPLFYPLPTVLLILPFALLSDQIAGPLFSGASASLLAYALARRASWCLPALLGIPFLISAVMSQWSPLLVAGTLFPWVGGVLMVKPALGAAIWLGRPSRAAVVGVLLMLLASLAILPSWPLDWAGDLGRTHHWPPLLSVPLGPLLGLALLRWRDRRALLLFLACAPQNLWFYDQLPIALVAGRWRESLFLIAVPWLGVLSWLGLGLGDITGIPHQLVLALTYGPALVLLLARPQARP